MSDGPRIPQPGDLLSASDVEMIFEAIKDRNNNFRDEPMILSAVYVMTGIGNRFSKVTCVEEEWEGYMKDVPPGEGVPKCPNGHPLFRDPPLRLAWVQDIS